jgi:uncharacterized protein (TIGR03084 family)
MEIVDDLAAEHDALDVIVADIDGDAWDRPTPGGEWRVRDQIGHLSHYDAMALLAIDDPDAFAAHVRSFLDDPARASDEAMAPGREQTGDELLSTWRRGRTALVERGRTLDPSARIAWYGPPMSARSFLTARLMETWAHGQDVVDALGASRPPTDRLRHIAHLGVVTRGWSYAVRGLEAPNADVRVELTAPSGAAWSWGPDDAVDRVSGTALDFCLVVTQRRHVSETALVAEGEAANEWLPIAQCFAGPPTLADVGRG